MIHLVGYAALVLNLTSMTMKNIFYLRLLSLVANVINLIYGILIDAPPFVVGGVIAICIHSFYIYKLYKNKLLTNSTATNSSE